MNKLHLSVDAQKDLADIKRHIAEELENPQAALSTVSKITKEIRTLRDFPLIGTPLSSIYVIEKSQNYRFLVSGSYLVFYHVMKQEIYIDRVLYGRRDYLAVLLRELDLELEE